MLKVDIEVGGGGAPSLSSDIRIFKHAVVRSYSLIQKNKEKILIIAEPTGNIDYKNFLTKPSLLIDYPFEWVIIEFDKVRQKLNLEVSRYGNVPLFFCLSKQVVSISWDPIDIIKRCDNPSLNIERATVFLAFYAQPYSYETIINNVFRIPAGYSVFFETDNARGLKFHFENNNLAEISRVEKLLSNTKVSSSIFRLLKQYIEPWFINSELTICTHLSGGNDSGLISAVCSQIGQKYEKKVVSSGIIVTGKSSIDQVKRRNEYVKLFSLIDHPVYATDHPVLGKNSNRCKNNDYIPWTEGYREAFCAILDEFSKYKNPVMFTGAGGDELCYSYWDELNSNEQTFLREIYPVDSNNFITNKTKELASRNIYNVSRAYTGLISPSSVEDSGLSSVDALRLGIFPLSPFCDVEVVKFFRWLPHEYRRNRRAVKELLRELRVSECTANQKNKEDFSDFMATSVEDVELNNIISLLQLKNLDRLGLVNSDFAIKGLVNNNNGIKPSQIYAASVLEGALEFLL